MSASNQEKNDMSVLKVGEPVSKVCKSWQLTFCHLMHRSRSVQFDVD